MNINKSILLFISISAFFCFFTPETKGSVHSRRLARHARNRAKKNTILDAIDIQSSDSLTNQQFVDDVQIRNVPESNQAGYTSQDDQARQSLDQLSAHEHLIGTVPHDDDDGYGQEQVAKNGFENVYEEDTIEFNFENAGLDQLVKQIGSIFNITFISSDILNPDPQKLNIGAFKISFKTHKPLSKTNAWSLFLSFLEMSGFMTIPDESTSTINDVKAPLSANNNTIIYKIVPLDKAIQEPLPTFIGLEYSLLPKNDQIIRYIYFLENSTTASLADIVEKLKSSSGRAIALQEHNAFLFIDKAYNIRQLMKIITELDKVTMPQTMSVLKLRRADVSEVKKLYETLMQSEEKNGLPARLFPQKKSSSSSYFPEVKMVAERVSNSLILLGSTKAVKKIENFITEYIDTEIKKPFAPFFTHQLKYADASTIANIMNEVTKFGGSNDTEENQLIRSAGGVRGGDKYLKPMLFIPEKETNQLIIKGDYGDYLMAKEIIEQLDEPQPQIGIEVFILSLNLTEARILGAQLRSREPCGANGLLGNNIKYQTSGLRTGPGNFPRGIVENPNGAGIQRLLGDLINLVTTAEAGNTIISLGDQLGVWAIVQALQTMSSTQVVSNPFLLVTNKTKAKVSIGETRRIVTSEIVNNTTTQSTRTFGDNSAALVVEVTPIINSDGMIVLSNLHIELDTFIGAIASTTDVRKDIRDLKTEIIVADKEVVALGGLIQNTSEDNRSKVPVLGNIPLLGWLFKNKLKTEGKDSLLILISSTIIEPAPVAGVNAFTQQRINQYEEGIAKIKSAEQLRDPINRWFFEDSRQGTDYIFDNFTRDRVSEGREKLSYKQPKKINKKNNPETPDGYQGRPVLAKEMSPAQKNGLAEKNNVQKQIATLASQQKRSIAQFFDSENTDEVTT